MGRPQVAQVREAGDIWGVGWGGEWLRGWEEWMDLDPVKRLLKSQSEGPPSFQGPSFQSRF